MDPEVGVGKSVVRDDSAIEMQAFDYPGDCFPVNLRMCCDPLV